MTNTPAAQHNQPSSINDKEIAKLQSLLNSLYPDEQNLAPRFREIVEKRRADRPAELVARDQKLPRDWYYSHIHAAYVLYADLFCADLPKGNKLIGLTDRLTYFKTLGIDLLHLLPLLDSTGDAGFAVRDFNVVNSDIGTLEDLQQLIRRCHKQRIFVALDFVLNHVADTHIWAQQALSDRHYRDYFVWDATGTGEPWPGVPDIFPEFAPGHWDFVPNNGPDAEDASAEGQWVWSTFYSRRPRGREADWPVSNFAQWDLNYANPEVLLEMLDQLLAMANWGVDVFRLDAVPFLWKKPGTSCTSRPEGHIIVKVLRWGLDQVAPCTTLLAEACQPLDQIFDFFGEGNEVQSAYHFELMGAFWKAMAGFGVANIQEVIQRTAAQVSQRNLQASPPHWWVFSECHDEVSLEMLSDSDAEQLFHYYIESGGIPFRFRPEDTFGRGISGTTYTLLRGDLRRILLLWKLQSTLGSTPLFYMGAELGLPNDLSYQADKDRASDSRFVKRIPLGAGWTDRFAVPVSTEDEDHLYQQLARWLHWRREHPCLAQSPEFFTTGSSEVLGFMQGQGTEQLLLVANCSDGTVNVRLPDERQVEVEPWQLWCSDDDTPDGLQAGRLI
jgi:amylosucrase